MKLTFLGDIFPADLDFTVGLGIKSEFEKKSGINWKDNILSITKDSDFVIGNLESPLMDSSIAVKGIFYGVPNFSDFLKECNINVVNVANNHILEHGKRGYDETITNLINSKIAIIGNKNQILHIEQDGLRIGIAGFNGVDLKCFDNDNCFSELNENNVLSALEEMSSKKVDIKIFCFHWGNEYIHLPSDSQRSLAYKLIDGGADIIIGHHPHTIQPYEQYNGKHIFYSLGNFCFDNPYQSRQFSKGLVVTFDINTLNKSVESFDIVGVKLHHKRLVTKLRQSSIEKYLKNINQQYLLIKDKKNYQSLYAKEHKKRHLSERVLMKLSMITQLLCLNMSKQIIFIRNVYKFYLKNHQ